MNSNVGRFKHVYIFVITSPVRENPTDLHILNVLLVDCSLSHHVHTSAEVHSTAATLRLHRSRKAWRINTALTDMSTHDEKIISTLYLLDVPYNHREGVMVGKQAQMDLGQVLKLLDRGIHILDFNRQAPTRNVCCWATRQRVTQSPGVTLKTLQLRPHRTPTHACSRKRA